MKRGRPKRLSLILREEWESIPSTPENQERRDKIYKKMFEQQKLEFTFAKLKLKKKSKQKKSEQDVVITNPGARSVLDKALGKGE